jgi:hypothetical protein
LAAGRLINYVIVMGRSTHLDKALGPKRSHPDDDEGSVDEEPQPGGSSKRVKGEEGETIPATNDAQQGQDPEKKGNRRNQSAIDSVSPRLSQFRPSTMLMHLQARKRDGYRCVFTKTGPAEAAHIIPHTINKTATHATNARHAIQGLLGYYNGDLLREVLNMLVPLDKNKNPILKNSDFDFNLMMLNPFVHKLLDGARIGLKPINTLREEDPEDTEKEFICVEWRYLPKRVAEALAGEKASKFLVEAPATGRPAAVCGMNLDSDELSDFFQHYLQDPQYDELGGGFPCVYLENGRRIESGFRFKIPVYKKDAAKTFRLLELSWLVLRIASISGAAEALEYLRDRPDDDWQGLRDAVQKESFNRAMEMIRRGREAEAAEAAEGEDRDPARYRPSP